MIGWTVFGVLLTFNVTAHVYWVRTQIRLHREVRRLRSQWD